MREIVLALARALRSLRRPRLLWHLLWPTLIALSFWTVVALSFWSEVVEGLMAVLAKWPFLGGWMQGSEILAGAAALMVNLLVLLLLVPLIYVSAALLVSVFAVPMMLERVARHEYPALQQRQGGSMLASAANAVWASLIFVVVLLLSLPLWLIPGAGLIISVLLTAWLNRRTFGYDALVLHADRAELVRLLRMQRRPMLWLGAVCALLAYVPVLNLLAPALTALAFVHFMLPALEEMRRGDV